MGGVQDIVALIDCANIPGSWTATFEGQDRDQATPGFAATGQNQVRFVP